MTSNISVSFPIDQLAEAILERIQSHLHNNNSAQDKLEIYKTRKETAEMLSISLPTLNSYTKKKILLGYRLGRRVLYKESEIEKALLRMKYGKDW